MNDERTEPFLRLFIAIAIPPDVCKEINRAQGQLKRFSPPGSIRWTRPDQFHVTLKFLGDVPSAQVSALETAVAKVCGGFNAIKLSAHGIGFFPRARQPRVIWAGADDNGEALEELHRQLDEAVLPFAPAENPGKFTGHITLGRFKPGHHAAIPRLLERAEKFRNYHFGDWVAEAVVIFRSDLSCVGAMHAPLASYPLTK